MRNFNQQPNYKQSFTRGIRGARTSDGNYDMVNKKTSKCDRRNCFQ